VYSSQELIAKKVKIKAIGVGDPISG